MRKCYTISGAKSLLEIEGLEVGQFTLNGRQFPSKRRTVETLKEVRSKGCHVKTVVHYDFIYIISRFSMFTASVKQAIISEVVDILKFADEDGNIEGVIMHTDYPLKKEFNSASDKAQFIKDNYNSSIWDSSSIERNMDNVAEQSVLEFYEALKEKGTFKTKVYIENTTKVGPYNEGSLDWIVDLFDRHPELKQYFGIVYDTEHHYAVSGYWLSVEDINYFKSIGLDVIVHLNTVPREVKPYSRRDRHSETTIYECYLHPSHYYEKFSSDLDNLGIVWVREVKSETMLREINHEQCSCFSSSNC